MAVSVRRGAKKATGGMTIKIYPAGRPIPKLPPGAVVISEEGTTGSNLIVGTKSGNIDYGKTNIGTKIVELEESINLRLNIDEFEALQTATANMLSGGVTFSNISVSGGTITATTISAGTYLGLNLEGIASLETTTAGMVGGTVLFNALTANSITATSISALEGISTSTAHVTQINTTQEVFTDVSMSGAQTDYVGTDSNTAVTISANHPGLVSVTGGLNIYPPGASTSASKFFTVGSGGHIGINTNAPSTEVPFYVEGSASASHHLSAANVITRNFTLEDTGVSAAGAAAGTGANLAAISILAAATATNAAAIGSLESATGANKVLIDSLVVATGNLVADIAANAAGTAFNVANISTVSSDIVSLKSATADLDAARLALSADTISAAVDSLESATAGLAGASANTAIDSLESATAALDAARLALSASTISADLDTAESAIDSLESATAGLSTITIGIAAGTGSNLSLISSIASLTAGNAAGTGANAANIASLISATGELEALIGTNSGSITANYDTLSSATAHLASLTASLAAGTGVNAAAISSLQSATATLAGATANAAFDSLESATSHLASMTAANAAGTATNAANITSLVAATGTLTTDVQALSTSTIANAAGTAHLASLTSSFASSTANAFFDSLESATAHLAAMTAELEAGKAGISANQAFDSLESATAHLASLTGTNQAEIASLESATSHLASMTATNAAGTAANASAIDSLESSTAGLLQKVTDNMTGTAFNASNITSLESATAHLATLTSTAAAITAQDEVGSSSALMTDISKFTFIGTNILARQGVAGEVKIYSPAPGFQAAFNSGTGVFDSITSDSSVMNQGFLSTPDSNGSPFYAGTWATDGDEHPITTSASIAWRSDFFSDASMATLSTVMMDEAGDPLAIHAKTLSTGMTGIDWNVSGLQFKVSTWRDDGVTDDGEVLQKFARVDFDVFPSTGSLARSACSTRISVKAELFSPAGDQLGATWNSGEWFHEKNRITPTLGNVRLHHKSISTRRLSGVGHYGSGSQFNLSANDIDYINSETWFSTTVDWTAHPNFGAAPSDTGTANMTGWTRAHDNVNASAFRNSVSIGSSESSCGSHYLVGARPRDPHGFGSYQYNPTSSLLIHTWSTGKSTAEDEYFMDEDYRLTASEWNTAPGADEASWKNIWDSSLSSGQTAGTASGLQVAVSGTNTSTRKFVLVYPQMDYTGTMPAGSNNPDYSTFGSNGTVTGYYWRAFYHTAQTNVSQASIYLYGITKADLEAKTIYIDIKVPTKTGWLSLNEDYNAGTYTGADGDGAWANRSAQGASSNYFDAIWGNASNDDTLDANTGWAIVMRVRYPTKNTAKILESRNGSTKGISVDFGGSTHG